MSFTQNVTISISMLVGLIFFGMALRGVGILKEEHGGLLANLVTHVTLPALILIALSNSHFTVERLLLAVVMISAELACALLAWGVSILLKLSRPRKGALILASTFGSSAFLGYAVVKSVYEGNANALADAAIVSELGVGLLLFTVGVVIAINYGTKSGGTGSRRSEVVKFFYSPIFIALVVGVLFSIVQLPQGFWAVQAFFRTLAILAGANTFLVTMTIGVMIHFRDLRRVLPIVFLACALKLVAQPLVAAGLSSALSFQDLWRHILVMEASMPTAAMTAVFAKRYGCDAELTSILIFATFISSIFTMIMIILLLG